MLLLTMVRKSELTEATWSEIDFANAVWTIPGVRMKRRNPHNVYLSNQVLDMLVALKTCASGSRYLLPNRYDPDRPMNGARVFTECSMQCICLMVEHASPVMAIMRIGCEVDQALLKNISSQTDPSTRAEINVSFGEQNRMRCKAATAPQRVGYESQKHIYL